MTLKQFIDTIDNYIEQRRELYNRLHTDVHMIIDSKTGNDHRTKTLASAYDNPVLAESIIRKIDEVADKYNELVRNFIAVYDQVAFDEYIKTEEGKRYEYRLNKLSGFMPYYGGRASWESADGTEVVNEYQIYTPCSPGRTGQKRNNEEFCETSYIFRFPINGYEGSLRQAALEYYSKVVPGAWTSKGIPDRIWVEERALRGDPIWVQTHNRPLTHEIFQWNDLKGDYGKFNSTVEYINGKYHSEYYEYATNRIYGDRNYIRDYQVRFRDHWLNPEEYKEESKIIPKTLRLYYKIGYMPGEYGDIKSIRAWTTLHSTTGIVWLAEHKEVYKDQADILPVVVSGELETLTVKDTKELLDKFNIIGSVRDPRVCKELAIALSKTQYVAVYLKKNKFYVIRTNQRFIVEH